MRKESARAVVGVAKKGRYVGRSVMSGLIQLTVVCAIIIIVYVCNSSRLEDDNLMSLMRFASMVVFFAHVSVVKIVDLVATRMKKNWWPLTSGIYFAYAFFVFCSAFGIIISIDSQFIQVVGVPATGAVVFLFAVDKCISIIEKSAKSATKAEGECGINQSHSQDERDKNIKEYVPIIALSAIPAVLGIFYSIKSAKRS